MGYFVDCSLAGIWIFKIFMVDWFYIVWVLKISKGDHSNNKKPYIVLDARAFISVSRYQRRGQLLFCQSPEALIGTSTLEPRALC